jgi:hypothetical protein
VDEVDGPEERHQPGEIAAGDVVEMVPAAILGRADAETDEHDRQELLDAVVLAQAISRVANHPVYIFFVFFAAATSQTARGTTHHGYQSQRIVDPPFLQDQCARVGSTQEDDDGDPRRNEHACDDLVRSIRAGQLLRSAHMLASVRREVFCEVWPCAHQSYLERVRNIRRRAIAGEKHWGRTPPRRSYEWTSRWEVRWSEVGQRMKHFTLSMRVCSNSRRS